MQLNAPYLAVATTNIPHQLFFTEPCCRATCSLYTCQGHIPAGHGCLYCICQGSMSAWKCDTLLLVKLPPESHCLSCRPDYTSHRCMCAHCDIMIAMKQDCFVFTYCSGPSIYHNHGCRQNSRDQQACKLTKLIHQRTVNRCEAYLPLPCADMLYVACYVLPCFLYHLPSVPAITSQATCSKVECSRSVYLSLA